MEKKEGVYLIAIDPDTHHIAYSIFKGGEFKEIIKTETDIKDVVKVFSKYNPFILAIETQYSKFNIKTLIQLVEVRAMIETIARLDGTLGIYRVPASTWQKSVLDIPPKTKRPERKEVSLKEANKFTGLKLTDNDLSDAINIGRYVLNNYENLSIV